MNVVAFGNHVTFDWMIIVVLLIFSPFPIDYLAVKVKIIQKIT